MAGTTLAFDKTEMGKINVNFSAVTTVTADDVVEIQAKALLGRMSLEVRRQQLANGNNSLGDIRYYTGRLG